MFYSKYVNLANCLGDPEMVIIGGLNKRTFVAKTPDWMFYIVLCQGTVFVYDPRQPIYRPFSLPTGFPFLFPPLPPTWNLLSRVFLCPTFSCSFHSATCVRAASN
jgi:hypothetical protein